MEGITLERSDRVDTGCHVPAVQVTTDVERTRRYLLRIEVIRHVTAHFPSLTESDIATQGQVMRQSHFVVHLFVIKLTARSIGERVTERQTPRDLRLDISVIHLLGLLLLRLGVRLHAFLVLLYRLHL